MQCQTQYSVQYDFDFKGDLVRPGSLIKVKCSNRAVRYECILHDVEKDKTYVVVEMNGQRSMIPIGWVRGLVLAKRSRRNAGTGTRTD